MPLGRHLLIGALVATLFPLLSMVALGLWQYQRDFASVEAFTGRESLSSARVVANFLDFLVEDTRSMLGRIARRVEAGTVTDEVLRFEVAHQGQTEGLEVTNARGIIILSSIGQQGRNVADLPYFRQVAGGKPIAYSDVFYSQWLHENVVMLAVPYLDRKGAFGGVVMARLHLKKVNELLSARLDDPRLRNTFVVDRGGHAIAHPDLELVSRRQSLLALPPVKAALRGESDWMRFEDGADRTARISGYVQMPGTGWAVVTTRTPGDAGLQVGERLQNQLLLALLAGLLAGAAALAWGRRLTRPLEALANTLRATAEDGFRTGAVPSLAQAEQGQDVAEIDTLAACYNALATELNRRVEEIIGLQANLEAHNEALNAHNEELALLSTQAQASNRLKSEFLASMSHELRTPLNSIIGYTELVLTEEGLDLDAQSRQNLEIVHRNARHLLTLINDILDLSKIEAGRLAVYAEPFDPAAMLESVVETARPLAEAKGLGLRLSLAPGLGRVASDETKVRQIVLNLVSNAIKFTATGDVSIALVPFGATRWAVVVADSGIGIAPEHQALVFEEFRQVDQGSTRAAGGTGLGLSIARQLARQLQGDLTLESAPGLGSTFTLELPRQLVVGPPATGVGAEPAAPREAPANLDVVIIDDDPLSLHLTAEKLKATAYCAVQAATPEEGLALVAERRPYAVILDVKMRRVDDWKLLRALKGNPATSAVPVVVASFDENKPLAFSLGAAACLRKPLETPALVLALDGLREAARVSAGIALVLGDDDAALEVYHRVLAGSRYDVRFARSGEEALRQIEQTVPALLVADLPMATDPLPFLDHWRQNPALRERPALIVMGGELSRDAMSRLPRFRQILPKIKLSPELLSTSLKALLSQLRAPIT